MDEKKPDLKAPVPPAPPQKEARPIPPPPRWEDMIYPERRRDPLRWLRH
ncbi:MAG: hypothetical protein QOJ39_3633 [Candidatus Eremiobacteraeota bacterium]|nr:hypothetical protein [Candidatus Eremiobacteraeota bacterium]